MTVYAFAQNKDTSDGYGMRTIYVNGQAFKIHPEIKIFINNDEQVYQAKDLQSQLEKLKPKEKALLIQQLTSIQGYSNVYGGERTAIDPVDFERYYNNIDEANKLGIKYTYYGDHNKTGRYSCVNGKFNIEW